MYRVFILIINLLVALSADTIFQPGVTLDVQAPAEVNAGTEFDITIVIRKGSLDGFSRLQQSFPAGLKATPSISSNADFEFEEKKVRLIWLRLPSQEEITVVYKIKADERLKGTFTIDSKFSFIDENERKSVSTTSEAINILPSPDIDPSLVVDIADYEDQVVPYIPAASVSGEMACIRQTPALTDGSYVVNLLVNKETRQKFAKIEEVIPAGYRAVSLNPREAIFTYKGNVAKFLWMNLPADPYFLVTYKLIPETGQGAVPILKGKFSYLEGEKTISLDIKQTSLDLASISPSEIGTLLASVDQPLVAENTGTNEKLIKTQETEIKEKFPRKPTEKTGRNKININKAYSLEPQDGIYYRVQLAAGHKAVNIEKYFKKYSLGREVRKEMHEGWHKYSIGSFSEYKEARDYRVHIWNTTEITDAFVSAYNSGTRITVQEALMVANQQWYK